AYRLNPLSNENKENYIDSLCFARYFDRLEVLLSQDSSLSDKHRQLLLYAAGRNGNINKYKQQLSRRDADNRIGELALLLFVHKHLTVEQKLSALERFNDPDGFLKQEILAAQTELYLDIQDIDRAEKSLVEAYEQNNYAFAPALGRFYAQYRNFGKALDVFEKHLAIYHDQSVAVQTAEIYCLLNKTDKIAKLRTDYQSDSGNRAMLCNYYFDALIALAKKDMTTLKELTAPLSGNINTPLSAFMFLCADIQSGNIQEIKASYDTLLAHRNYLNLQEQSDNMLSEFLKTAFFEKNIPPEKLLPLATILYNRKPDVFTAKFILLAQKKNNSENIILLKDALTRFGNDPGVIKIAIEYYLQHNPAEAERLVAHYKQKFAQKSGDMVRYELFLNMQKKEYEKVSLLFRSNFKQELLPDYWRFAGSTMREKDLIFLSRDKLYEPFCLALLHLKKNEVNKACDLLEKADAKNNYALLFFAAKTLAENGRNQSALKKYALFPEKSPYTIAVLLNMAELYAEDGNINQALILSARAYNLAPSMPETQLCYADKLHKKGDWKTIPDIVKLSSSNPYRRRLEPLWISGMEQRIKNCNINTQREKIRELCRQLLVIAPDNNIAVEYLKKLYQMPQ
ncbi:MAG: hypothetical protein IJN59_03060, partial [Oscillospiraceae bacterium]|nr:hypothetical protein [Oscillospiraceae bacterium]